MIYLQVMIILTLIHIAMFIHIEERALASVSILGHNL